MTTTPATSNVELLIEAEPRLKNYGNANLRNFIASQMIANDMSFEDAEKSVVSLLMSADSMKTEVKEKVEKQRVEAKDLFDKAVYQIVQDTAKSLGTLPQGGIVIRVDPDAEYKNPDKSPMMDANNNPVRGIVTTIDFLWDTKKTRATNPNSVDGRGRPSGDYVFGDVSVGSMRAYIRDTLKLEEELKSSEKSPRAFLEEKGYKIPESPSEGTDGKMHTVVTMPTA